ncbi:MAG: N-6 DNA methylase, partial [Anaerolineales bacterium]|nr:N-6 DNA methylase [Anaerolineales bacterium]
SFSIYLQAITKNLARGNATEHTHRPALKALLESLDAGITATNEPQHIVDVGAPDFIVERGKTPLGYVETKEVGENLDKIEKSEQLKRYRAALPNLLLTDYLEFRWYVDGERRDVVRLGEWNGKKITVIASREAAKQSPHCELGIASAQRSRLAMTEGVTTPVAALLQQFIAHTAPSISKPKDLAERIAALAQLMRDVIEKTFARESERGNLHEWFAAFQETLIPDLTPAQFADMFAQTIAYGMFAARANDPTPKDFSRMEAAFVLPKTNPFLRKLFHEIAGPDLDPRVAWIADDLANLLARADMERVLKDFGKRTRREDPVVHFYETFLAAYDSKLRKARGVYYTPEPVVSYIVRSVDTLLRKEFGKANGLADPSVLLLDPAVGTATFLYFVIQQIHETLTAQGQHGAWAKYVAEKLLPRLFGFEILMAPYTVAHLKLGVELKELGYDFASEERLGIYLTNTLEQAAKKSERLLAKFISDESDAAAAVKRDQPIMVVIGNPPYANFGMMNKGEWIEELLKDYKQGLREKKLNLDEDSIKFIRFGQWRIERSGAGILAFITNNTYIDGITHRRMRQSLLETFDDIYILDLHGSSKKKEKCPDGSKDENV